MHNYMHFKTKSNFKKLWEGKWTPILISHPHILGTWIYHCTCCAPYAQGEQFFHVLSLLCSQWQCQDLRTGGAYSRM